jgi:tetratricopeptide (TPR) repeat protein
MHAPLILTALAATALAAVGSAATARALDSYPVSRRAESLRSEGPAGAALDSLLARAERHLALQQPGLALRLYRQIPDASPRKARGLLGEGTCLFAAGEYEAALRRLRDARTRADGTGDAPEIAAACLELSGQCHLYLGRTAPARRAFRELAEAHPARDDHCRVMIARTYVVDGAYRNALDEVAPVLGSGRFAPAYDFALGLFWKLEGKDRQRMNRLLERFLAISQREYTGRG